MIAHPKLFTDHYSHPLARPRFSPKAVSLGSPLQELGYPGALLLAQARRGSRGGVALKRLNSSLPSPPPSLAYRSLAHAQGVGYPLLGPAFSFEFEGSKAPSLAPVGGFF